MRSVGLNGNIVEDSPLFTQDNWPPENPSLQDVGIEVQKQDRETLIANCAKPRRGINLDWLRSLQSMDAEEKLCAILNHKSVQFNSKRAFSTDRTLNSIRQQISVRGSTDIIIPAFCVISSWQKRFDVTSVTLAEEVSFRYMATIAKLASIHSGIHVRILIVSDATFYAPIFRDPLWAASKYVTDLRIISLDSINSDHLSVIDMKHVLGLYEKEYDSAFEKHRRQMEEDYSLNISQEEARRWWASVGSTVNFDDLNLSYHEKRYIYTQERFPSAFIEREFRARIDDAFMDYRAMKLALGEIEWDTRTFPRAIRASIHHKTDGTLGLRVYPEYKRSSMLLPYHGVAVISGTCEEPKMRIEWEISAAKRYQRAIKPDGSTDFYIDSEEIAGELGRKQSAAA